MELYRLTKAFVVSLQPKFYWQYFGDLDDLASDFFTSFITPKSRSGKKETLLDKFNPETTSLAYLVKVCVTRKLIDQSRQHPVIRVSLDNYIEDKGDFVLKSLGLCTKEDNSALQDPRFQAKILDNYRFLDEETANKCYVELFDSDSQLCSLLQPKFRYLRQYPIQQITNKTAVIFIPYLRRTVNFSLEDGRPKGTKYLFSLTIPERDQLKAQAPYHSQFSKALFEEFCVKTICS